MPIYGRVDNLRKAMLQLISGMSEAGDENRNIRLRLVLGKELLSQQD
jgi:hypothetical protein